MPRRHGDLEVANEIASSLGKRLRQLRQQAGCTQAQLSHQVGLTAEAYARLERGRSLPSFPTLLRLGNALRVPTDALLGDAQRQLRGDTSESSDHQDLALEFAALPPPARETIRGLVRQLTGRTI